MSTTNLTNLNDHKTKKKYTKIVDDINSILMVLHLTVRSLIFFKSYIVVQEIISVITTNITLLEIKKNKYEKELKNL